MRILSLAIIGSHRPGPLGRSFVAQRLPDGVRRSLVVVETLPGARILKRDLATGERTLIRELRPEDPTGITVFRGTVAPSGDTFAAFYVRGSTALFLARGLR